MFRTEMEKQVVFVKRFQLKLWKWFLSYRMKTLNNKISFKIRQPVQLWLFSFGCLALAVQLWLFSFGYLALAVLQFHSLYDDLPLL